jgi:hypothetical protein
MSTVTVPQPPATATENSITIEPGMMDDAHQDLEFHIHLLRNELNDDFETNARTQRLTDNQKALLPLYAQLITAHSTYSLQDWHLELLGCAEKMAARR